MRSMSVSAAAGLGGLLLGGAGFVAGFLGPIVLNPGANQGPLLGIFLTGPGGAIIGAILGTIFAARGWPARKIANTLAVIAAIGVVTILFFCLPQPEYRGNVVDVEIVSCAPPESLKEEAFTDWEKRIASAPWGSPRADWRGDFARLVSDEPGVVVTVRVKRAAGLYENRKPWNHGTFGSGKAWWVADRYFRRGIACSDATAGVFTARGTTSKAWPADNLPGFLNLQVLEPASARESSLLARTPG
jgi:hypothetical protein